MLLFSSRHAWEGWVASFASTVYTSVPFHFSSATPPNPALSLSKVFHSLATVSQSFHGTRFPSCLCSSAQFVCRLSLCKCVLALFPFAHHNSPFICGPLYTHSNLGSASLPGSCFSSGMDNPPPPCSFSRGQRLRHARGLSGP